MGLGVVVAVAVIEKAQLSPIGQILVEENVVTSEQLKRTLKIQKRLERHRQTGEILVELGYATRKAISDAIVKHGYRLRIGELLVEQGYITQEDLDKVLQIQKSDGKCIGRVLVESGYINERILLQNLAHQAQVPYVEITYSMLEPGVLKGISSAFMERHMFIPFCKDENGSVVVVCENLQDPAMLEAVSQLFQGNHTLALSPSDCIQQAIQDFQTFRGDAQGNTRESENSEENSIIQLANNIIEQAIEAHASDIHIEPMESLVRIRYRVDGVLVYKTDLPLSLHNKLSSRIKIMAECNITERRQHQGGRILFQQNGRDVDLRLSSYVTIYGECLVMRILSQQVGLESLDDLGMTPSMLQRYHADVLDQPSGVVIITGPTGSGKTTTLYSSLDYCNEIDRKIITVEDPVEFVIEGIIQCSVNEKMGRTFEMSLREIVRQDPDIIVLGEIRDRITCETAIQAALTGHKVYSTFHTEDTIGGLMRLLNMEIEAFLISSTVLSVVAQRLLRRICTECAAPYTPSMQEIKQTGISIEEAKQYEYKKGSGCTRCNYTGYRGRVGVFELLVVNEPVKESILKQDPAHVIRRISMESSGLVSMREDAIAKIIRGLTTFSEVNRHTPNVAEVRSLDQILSLTQ